MNNNLNKKILELIFDYAQKNNGVIYKENKASKWQFISEEKWKALQKIQTYEKNNKAFNIINTKEQLSEIEQTKNYLNIYITSQGQKIFKSICKSLSTEEKKEFYNIYGYFCTFKQGLITLLNENKKDAQYFFEHAIDQTLNLKIRSVEEEKFILDTSRLIYDSPKELAMGLKNFLSHSHNYYQSKSYNFDSYERQFILKDFIEKNLEQIGVQPFAAFLSEFNSNTKESEGLFLKDETEFHLIHIDKNKVYQYIPLLELDGQTRAQTYKSIINYTKDFIHSELKHVGVISCDNHYDSDDTTLKANENLYYTWLVKVRGIEKITEQELKEFIVSAIELLSEKREFLTREKEADRKDFLHNALKIKLKNKLLDNLNINQQSQKTIKI